MKKVILLLLLLVACQPSPTAENHDEHIGCPPEQISAGTCELADEGERNVDIFDDLNLDLIKTESVSYVEGANGYLAQPKAEGVYPAVIMIHEFWGLNDNIKYMAGLLAQEGYVVLAVDLYGEVAETSDRARELASAARENQEKASANMKKAAEYLRGLPSVNKEKMASMGWCFGGGQSLQLALSGEKLAATVIYYGNLVTEKDKLSAISWPVLGIFGAEDTGIPVSSVESFKQSLNELNVKNEIHIYPGVGHAFANPSGARYAPAETKDAWDKTRDFLKRALKEQSETKSILEGTVSIGPICPVERIPPDPSCQPTPEMYKAWPLEITQNGKKIATVVANDGTFSVELAPGTYVVDLERKMAIGGSSVLPATIEIKPGETTALNIDIDTGIR